jgi:hypothetical protein
VADPECEAGGDSLNEASDSGGRLSREDGRPPTPPGYGNCGSAHNLDLIPVSECGLSSGRVIAPLVRSSD